MKVRLTEQQLRQVVKTAIHEAVNKRSIIHKLYKTVDQFTHSRYHDSGWAGVDAILEALQNAGYDVSVSVKDGGYRNSKGGNTLFAGSDDVSYWKEFDLTIPVDGITVGGQIRCHLCGTMDDPFSAYDMTCSFW